MPATILSSDTDLLNRVSARQMFHRNFEHKILDHRPWRDIPCGNRHLSDNQLEDARNDRFDVVVAEGLDRLSRDQEHIAAFFKQMQFLGIPIVTVAEGEISELHIGLKGTMSSLFLKELAQKTRRGLEGRVLKGKSGGGKSYGYDVVRNLQEDGSPRNGERTINEDQAEVIRRIFRDYSYGLSPRVIRGNLNKEGVSGPRSDWGMSTIYGNWRRGTGILNNELYIGKLVWNRQRYIKDPSTGKRQERLNPAEEWVVVDVPEQRIVSDALWNAVKARQEATRSTAISDGIHEVGRTKRPKHLFSGLLKCGTCGGGVIQVGKQYYGCSASRNKRTCDNHLTMKRDDLEARVLTGLKDRLLHPVLIEEYSREYLAEYNRLAGSIKQDRARTERELAEVVRQIDRFMDAIADGMYNPSMKAKMTALEARKMDLEAELRLAPTEAPVMLHPSLAVKYRQDVANLQEALNDPATKAEATSIIRSLLTEIRLVPEGDRLGIELQGELAGLLALDDPKNSESHRLVASSTVMVAGARYQRYLRSLTHTHIGAVRRIRTRLY